MYINKLGKTVNAWKWLGTRASYDDRPKWIKSYIAWKPAMLVLNGGEIIHVRGDSFWLVENAEKKGVFACGEKTFLSLYKEDLY